MDIVRNPNHKVMEQNLPIITYSSPPIGIGVLDHIKVHYQFNTMFMQTHQEILYLKEIFQNIHSRFLDALDHLLNHPSSVAGTEKTTLRTHTMHDKRSVFFQDQMG